MKPKVLLIGDSISIGYTEPTQRMLDRQVDVERIPMNGGPTIRGIQNLEEWLGERDWDIIHFNFGLHDLKFTEEGQRQVPLDEYEEKLRQIVKRLEDTGARLIWASTTPVPDGDVQPPRTDEDVVAYNAAAREIMDKHGISINDLYSRALPILDEIQKPVNVHFTEEGSRVLAQWVVETIEAELEELDDK